MRVDLPDPDGPMTATYSPSLDLEGDAAERVDLERPGAVGLPDVVDLDDGPATAG